MKTNSLFAVCALFLILLSPTVASSDEESAVTVVINNTLAACVEITEMRKTEDDNKSYLDTLWQYSRTTGDCGCKSAALTYRVNLPSQQITISQGIISSLNKTTYRFLLNPDTSIRYKGSVELRINCSAL